MPVFRQTVDAAILDACAQFGESKFSFMVPLLLFLISDYISRDYRGVAQPGSVLAWGASGRRFKSARPDFSPPMVDNYISLDRQGAAQLF